MPCWVSNSGQQNPGLAGVSSLMLLESGRELWPVLAVVARDVTQLDSMCGLGRALMHSHQRWADSK